MTIEEIKKKAIEEVAEEDFRAAVDAYKVKLRKRKWWHTVIPWRILIVPRERL